MPGEFNSIVYLILFIGATLCIGSLLFYVLLRRYSLLLDKNMDTAKEEKDGYTMEG